MIQLIIKNLQDVRKTVWIPITWLPKKPADLDQHRFNRVFDLGFILFSKDFNKSSAVRVRLCFGMTFSTVPSDLSALSQLNFSLTVIYSAVMLNRENLK